jgi:hypothetical protein
VRGKSEDGEQSGRQGGCARGGQNSIQGLGKDGGSPKYDTMVTLVACKNKACRFAVTADDHQEI